LIERHLSATPGVVAADHEVGQLVEAAVHRERQEPLGEEVRERDLRESAEVDVVGALLVDELGLTGRMVLGCFDSGLGRMREVPAVLAWFESGCHRSIALA
jgi:hypothetical protein